MTARTTTQVDTQALTRMLLDHAAGYVAYRAVNTGLHSGLLRALAQHGEGGVSPEALAEDLGFDAFYVAVWCRAAFAAGVLERAGDGYTLAPGLDELLLDERSPAYAGGLFDVLERPEMFDAFTERLPTGERLWWDECSPEWIAAVGRTGRPYYTRLVPGGLERIPGLADALDAGGAVLDTACGTGAGLERLAATYPQARVVGADGDAYSLELARRRLDAAGLSQRVELVQTPLEALDFDGEFDVVTNSLSMHECRDIERVTANVHRALRPGGWFVISDFPFPDSDEGLRSLPGRVMTGIQHFEALIDDQLLPVAAYLDLLQRHGFREISSFALTPMHAVTYGRR